MPRPKGSKNKKSVAPVVEDIDQKIAAAEAEIEELGAQLKAKKAELKALIKEKEDALAAAAEKKAEEEKAKLLDALAKSGKSIDEIIEFLGK
jgi:putative sterol carrier protein